MDSNLTIVLAAIAEEAARKRKYQREYKQRTRPFRTDEQKAAENARTLAHYHNKIDKKAHASKIQARRHARKDKAIALFGGKCLDCARAFPRSVYDFHHVDGTKELHPGTLWCLAWKNALEELQKCVLLCANCHRIRHHPD